MGMKGWNWFIADDINGAVLCFATFILSIWARIRAFAMLP